MAICLEGIAWTVCVLGDARRAALLLGAAQKRREERGLPDAGASPAAPSVASSPGSTPASARQAFTEAWLAGRALSLDAAVAEAYGPIRGSVARQHDRKLGCQTREAPSGLTPRELDVLRLLVEGRSDREIGEALFIGTRTVQTHVANLFAKLGVNARAEAAAVAVRRGLV